MTKRKKVKKHTNSKILTYIAWALAGIAFLLSVFIIGYYVGYAQANKETLAQKKNDERKRLELIKKLEQATKEKEHKSVNARLKEVLKKSAKEEEVGAMHEYADVSKEEPPVSPKREFIKVSKKPKLAIIFDDVSFRSQVNAIKSLNLPVTMSFFPPSPRHPNTAKLASKENFYMVHLPMEAQNFSKEEEFTLRVGDSESRIKQRINSIRKYFPRVHYINNHTGSKFTSSESAMNKLIYVLKSKHINFIDSRTTAQTKAPEVMKNFGLKYVARDVFLDHHTDIASVKKQIKEAIKKAKEFGSAIAIGHPHPNTILAIHDSKKLFKDVQLVQVNKLY